jgi:uncharacterized membrane protein
MPDSPPPAPGPGPAEPDPVLASASRRGLLARAGRLEYDRILFFSDAVFAIAITLLIVDLPVRVENAVNLAGHHTFSSRAELGHAVPGIIGFGISFAVIALFWVGHHSLFRFVTAFDRRLMLANLLFLGTIAFLPYPTALLSAVSSNQEAAVVFYAACAGSAGLIETLMWLYATHTGLVGDTSPGLRRLYLLRTVRVPVVFALSIVVAVLVTPRVATYSWTAILVLGFAIHRYYGRHEAARPDGPPDPGPADPQAAA